MTIQEFKKLGYYINYSVPTIHYYNLDLDNIDNKEKTHDTSLDEIFESADQESETLYTIMNNKGVIVYDEVDSFEKVLQIIDNMQDKI